MGSGTDGKAPATRTRMIVATIVVILTVAIVWKIIDYRMQPPPPPNPIGAPP